LQRLNLGHSLAVPLLAPILANALAASSHSSDLGLENRTVASDARCLHLTFLTKDVTSCYKLLTVTHDVQFNYIDSIQIFIKAI
jgi:hypothetical protein